MDSGFGAEVDGLGFSGADQVDTATATAEVGHGLACRDRVDVVHQGHHGADRQVERDEGRLVEHGLLDRLALVRDRVVWPSQVSCG
jgi:hypothetical protein